MNIRHFTVFAVLLMLSITAGAQTAAQSDSIVSRFFNDSDSNKLTKNDFVQSTENAFQLLNGAQTEAVLSWTVLEAKDRLFANRKIVRVLRKALRKHTNSGFRNLQLYRNMLQDIQAGNQRVRAILKDTEKQLEDAHLKIRSITKDTVIIAMINEAAGDTSPRKRTVRLQKEYRYTTHLIKTSLDSVHRWIAVASFQSIATSEMLQKADSIMQQSSIQALKGDCSFLWHASVRVAVVDTSSNDFTAGTKENNQIVRHYVRKNLTRILWIPIILFILFFRWIRKNYKHVKPFPEKELLNEDYMRFTRRNKILSSMIVSLSLFPLLDVHAPWFYLLLSQCILAGAVTWFFLAKPVRAFIPVWLLLIGLLVVSSVINSFEADLLQRSFLIALNVVSVIISFLLFPRIRLLPQLRRTVRIVGFVFIFLNLMAIISNLFGRVIIAEALTNTAIISITQIITLSVFIQIISEALYLQLLGSRIKRGITPVFEYESVLKSVHKPLFVFAMLIWVSMFSANMYMYEMLKGAVTKAFGSTLSLGSISFSVGNVLLFFTIIWIAHLLQKYIGSFFGDTDNDEDLESKKQRSRMMVIKLMVICVGYLLAVAASGLPLDKITIILGALGVGVGMGLQSIVNNFVSGVVLIFDRPLQIGDSIEVGENKGRVKGIGIRASTLLTAEGAEVIIPNGDILSRPITNWTLSNTQRRMEIGFKLKTSESRDVITAIIKDAVASFPEVDMTHEPAVLIESITDEEMELKVYFWCDNISKADWVRSEVRFKLFGIFREKGIHVI